MFQTTLRHMHMNENIKSAIDEPRPHHQLVPMKIYYEIGAKIFWPGSGTKIHVVLQIYF